MGLFNNLSSWIAFLASIGSFIQVLVYLPLVLEITDNHGFCFYSMSLCLYYFITASISLALRNTRLAYIRRILTVLQPIAVPALLLLCLNLYSSSSRFSSPIAANSHLLQTLPEWWDKVLRLSSPVYATLEAISTVLGIQAAGQISAHFVEDRSESWQFVFLLSSSATYVLCAWNLWRAFQFAAQDPLDATLIGASITAVVFLTGISFGLRRGSSVEASLFLSYVVLNIYYISSEVPAFTSFLHHSKSHPALPQGLLQSFTAILEFLRTMFGQGVDFISAAATTMPLPVLVTLVYRFAVLYLGGNVLLAWKRGRNWSPRVKLSQEDPIERIFSLILGYSRCILVCVYTHLLLLDNTKSMEFWRWTSVALVLGLWAVEILLSSPIDEPRAVVRGWRLKKD